MILKIHMQKGEVSMEPIIEAIDLMEERQDDDLPGLLIPTTLSSRGGSGGNYCSDIC